MDNYTKVSELWIEQMRSRISFLEITVAQNKRDLRYNMNILEIEKKRLSDFEESLEKDSEEKPKA